MITDKQKAAVHFCEQWLNITFEGDIEDKHQVSTFLEEYLQEAKDLYNEIKYEDKTMNARQRNKYCDYANCSHRVYNEDILSYDPYFKQIEDYCKLGRYGLEEDEECRCYNCKKFTLSRRDMKKVRELKAKIKAESKLYFLFSL